MRWNQPRARWTLAVAALVVALSVLAAGWAGSGREAGPTAKAQAAYDRGDWTEVVRLAREAIDAHDDQAAATRLLARALARLGRHEAAQRCFARLGERDKQAEDYYLLGSGLIRQGDMPRGARVLEEARKLDPDRAEVLDALVRIYGRTGRLAEAIEAAGRLARRPGWEVRGDVMLGLLDADHADPAGTAAALDRALKIDPRLNGAIASPLDARKILARALLRLGRPVDARSQLASGLADGPDPESSWLLSRAYLQEKVPDRAAAALADAGDFGQDDPTRFEPAPYVGVDACAKCHAEIVRAEQRSRHARTLLRPQDLTDLALPAQAVADPELKGVVHAFRRQDGTIVQETRAGEKTARAVVEYGLGSGDRGLTFVARDDSGTPRVSRISLYADRTIWDLTSNAAPRHSSDPDGILGRPLSADGLEQCLDCHRTSPRAARDPKAPEARDRGIGCERCHGPGGHHLAAVALNFDDLAIGRPSLAGAERVTRLCAACHRADDPSIDADDPRAVRFQTKTLPLSRCYSESDGALSCTTCHDPHRDAETSPAFYEARCLSCHSASPKENGPRRAPCPVNPARDCLSCHMPSVGGAAPHTNFTDHFIRVRRNGESSGR
ncbi:MAG TPA: tetratricopeptide repeat protein [Isosphaeraceae bacterium]|nr:tetratricopeptide repeat protein [Isosphaeraceae bacterium]